MQMRRGCVDDDDANLYQLQQIHHLKQKLPSRNVRNYPSDRKAGVNYEGKNTEKRSKVIQGRLKLLEN